MELSGNSMDICGYSSVQALVGNLDTQQHRDQNKTSNIAAGQAMRLGP